MLFLQFAVLALLCLLLANFERCDAQCTDTMDLGDDRSSHDYSEYGSVSIGAYSCTSSTIRVGGCSYGAGSSITLTMTSGTDIVLVIGWQSSYSSLYIDGELWRNFSGSTTCGDVSIELPQLTASTFEVSIVDPFSGCTGDVQIDSICVEGEVAPCLCV